MQRRGLAEAVGPSGLLFPKGDVEVWLRRSINCSKIRFCMSGCLPNAAVSVAMKIRILSINYSPEVVVPSK